MKNNAIAVVVGVLCAGPQYALAESFTQSFYCDGKIASVGDDSASIRLKCGAPMLEQKKPDACTTQSHSSPASHAPHVTQCKTVEEWTFNLGPGKFLHTAIIENGKVVAIRQGARVE